MNTNKKLIQICYIKTVGFNKYKWKIYTNMY